MRNIPILRGTITKKISATAGQLEVFCPYCDKYHRHGWDLKKKTARDKELRVPHCTNQHSAFRGTGYYIALRRKGDV